jgi:two-component system sensor histidine kinase KdpD
MQMRGNGLGKMLTPAGFPDRGYLWALLACAITTAIAAPLAEYLDLTNIVMLFLLTVLLVAARFGRGPAVLAAFVSVALFDFFFVPPQLSFTVNDAKYLVTFAVMLVVALVTGQLTAGLRQQAQAASLKERRTQALYEIARGLAGALSIEQAYEVAQRFSVDNLGLDAVLLLPDQEGELQPALKLEQQHLQIVERQFAFMAFDQGEPVVDNISGYGYGAGYFPLTASTRILGVMVFVPKVQGAGELREQKELLTAISSVVAITLERLQYVEAAQKIGV